MDFPLLPTLNSCPQRLGDFDTLSKALDYAAEGVTGFNFHDGRGVVTQVLSYRRLRRDALALARRLTHAGLRRGDRVAIVAETHPDVVTAFFGCQYAGLVPALVPLPAAFGGREIYVEHIRRLALAAHASALFVPDAMRNWLAPFAREAGLKAFGSVAALPDGPDGGPLPIPTQEDEIAYLQFSSGSTRFPVGIAVTQRALMANISAILRHGLRVVPEDRAVSWLPLYHDMGLVGFLLAPLAGQVTVDFLSSHEFARRPHVWLRLLSANRGTLSYSPSFGYELCTRRARLGMAKGPPLDLSAWRVAGIGGDMIRSHVLDHFAETFAADGFRAEAFVPSYGMAEATLAISFAPLGTGVATDIVDLDQLEREDIAQPATSGSRRTRAFVLCGLPVPGTEVEIRHAAGFPRPGRPLPEREVGRILVRGPGLMRDYEQQPEESAAALLPDGWLDTGDLGYLLNGQLVITGRAKDLIIVNGRNIWPQDLEWSVEQAVTSVRTGDTAAFAVEEDGVEQVVMLIEARGAPDSDTRTKLVAAAAGTLRARHGLEACIVLAPPGSLPHTSSGKLSRMAARALYLAGAFTMRAPVLEPVSE
ncbi:fatty acyl-AMP ligase [Siccirubricoccus sp. KC 17139]|uniref:Fatty acyl-AMP ligase n=1 Tax=Siccirubricoccus soli TaxID=2899147 RepID=A0ABT1D280_9PROT|nr:fatty acyl-AMP ligase [Siccirubricoccus soli]MCO6416028.1 fatty acyl-AMP ligase [Siccirubricoccus soli]MCP2682160.1 fatty acyl-AMP ligase [Siccirubricoccus soli]